MFLQPACGKSRMSGLDLDFITQELFFFKQYVCSILATCIKQGMGPCIHGLYFNFISTGN